MRTLALLTLAASAAVGGQALADDYPQPGLYKVVGKVSSAMMPMSGTHESEQCIEAHQFNTDPNAWMQQQQGQECEVVEYSLSGGNISMELKCNVQGSGTATIIGKGTYTDNSFQLQNVMHMGGSGMNIKITTDVTGTRQGSC